MRWTRTVRLVLAGGGGLVALASVLVGVADAGSETDPPSWRAEPSPNVGRTNILRGVHATAPGLAWAVGTANGGQQDSVPLLLRWDGTAWSQVAAPGGSDRLALSAVDGTGPDDVWAVGHSGRSPERSNAVLHWDGRTWRAVPVPGAGSHGDDYLLTGVVAVAPDDAWAVGRFDPAGPYAGAVSIILHWNGLGWRAVDHPCGAGLVSIDASSGADIWAVGGVATCHFDGSVWQAVPAAPIPTDYHLGLADVTVLPSGTALAVGSARYQPSCNYGYGCRYDGMAQRWDGTRWTVVEQPGAGPFAAVHAVSGSEIWVAATDGMYRFDGTRWTRLPRPSGDLTALSASGPGDVWTVGTTSVYGSPSRTLILHWPA